MQRWSALRKMIGALVACLLISLVVSPAVEAMTCVGEGIATQVTVVASDGAADTDSAPQTDKAGICLHGHCHQTVQFVGMALADPTPPPPMQAGIDVLIDGAVRWRFYRIDNPPRA